MEERQQHAQRLEVRAILHLGFHRVRKRRSGGSSTSGTAFLLDLVFRDPKALRGKIDDLAAFDHLGWLLFQRRMALLAFLGLMEHHFIDLRHEL
jgi:hypothetical protein